MRMLITTLAALALALPAAALADEGGTAEPGEKATQPSALAQCKTQRGEIGLASFKLLHGTNAGKANALGKCVARLAAAGKAVVVNAAKTCKAERAQPEDAFKAAHEGKTFAEHYGAGKNGRNAFGTCVAAHAAEAANAVVEALTSAARTCKAERALPAEEFKAAHGGKTFAEHYGTNARKANAFGKCVAAAARAAAGGETG